MIKIKYIILVSLKLAFIISCNNNNKIIISNQNNNTEIIKYSSGYYVKEYTNNIPNGRCLYFDSLNHIYKVEWYSNNYIPYFSYTFDKDLISKIENEDFKYIDTSFLKRPQITTIIYENGVELLIKFYTPIEMTRVSFFNEKNRLKGTSLNMIENSTRVFYNDEKSIEDLIIKFQIEDKNGKVIKTFSDYRITKPHLSSYE